MPRSPLPTPHLEPRAPRWLMVLAAVIAPLWVSGVARAESPGLEALDRYKAGHGEPSAVENRFFLKQNRFEVAPIAGYVPNNPFARRYMFGGILGFHFNETVSAQAEVLYSPDFGENDLKGLTSVLLERAFQANQATTGTGGVPVGEFQQPLDKAALTFAAGVAWAPLYGKINLVGETVLNFDFYMFGGVGMLSKKNYIATYDEVGAQSTGDIVTLSPDPIPNEVKVAPYIGIGQNYFLNRLMAFKIDLRAAFYIDNKTSTTAGEQVTQQRLYNNVIASGGLAFFFPNMKPRLYNF